MNLYLWILLYLAALIGHMAFWIGLFNRMHGTSLNIRWIRRSSYPFVALGIVCLPVVLYQLTTRRDPEFQLAPESFTALAGWWGIYTYACLAVFVVTFIFWLRRKSSEWKPPAQLVKQKKTHFDFSGSVLECERNQTEKFFAAIPGNQIYQCVVEEREIVLPGISDDLDGVTITHLSDFHLTGNICAAYFEKVVETAQSLQSDMIAITGDIIDRNRCWDWVRDILGKLSAPKGVYYILGNHDQRVGRESELREMMNHSGMIPVADTWKKIEIGGQAIHIAGNELPWFGKTMTISDTPDSFEPGDCRLLLSHSPDQWHWARQNDFDLVLAGHTHGGQIQLPWIGPIVSPSKHGVKYASGVFVQDGKVMVVTRGVSGEEPVRFFCPPEVGQLTIRSAS